jgi:hypothetical protein
MSWQTQTHRRIDHRAERGRPRDHSIKLSTSEHADPTLEHVLKFGSGTPPGEEVPLT